jgi:hypothetical protein
MTRIRTGHLPRRSQFPSRRGHRLRPGRRPARRDGEEARIGQRDTGGAFRRVAPAMGAILAISGCSLFFVNGPPPDHERRRNLNCTESRTAPVVDVLVAVLEASAVVNALKRDESDYRGERLSRGDVIALESIGMVVYGISSIVGFHSVGKCREAAAVAEGYVPGRRYPMPVPGAAPAGRRPASTETPGAADQEEPGEGPGRKAKDTEPPRTTPPQAPPPPTWQPPSTPGRG